MYFYSRSVQALSSCGPVLSKKHNLIHKLFAYCALCPIQCCQCHIVCPSNCRNGVNLEIPSTVIKNPGWCDDCKGRIKEENFSMIEFEQFILAPSLSALIRWKKTATATNCLSDLKKKMYPIYFFSSLMQKIYIMSHSLGDSQIR